MRRMWCGIVEMRNIINNWEKELFPRCLCQKNVDVNLVGGLKSNASYRCGAAETEINHLREDFQDMGSLNQLKSHGCGY